MVGRIADGGWTDPGTAAHAVSFAPIAMCCATASARKSKSSVGAVRTDCITSAARVNT
jgi:hypothetical protein